MAWQTEPYAQLITVQAKTKADAIRRLRELGYIVRASSQVHRTTVIPYDESIEREREKWMLVQGNPVSDYPHICDIEEATENAKD